MKIGNLHAYTMENIGFETQFMQLKLKISSLRNKKNVQMQTTFVFVCYMHKLFSQKMCWLGVWRSIMIRKF